MSDVPSTINSLISRILPLSSPSLSLCFYLRVPLFSSPTFVILMLIVLSIDIITTCIVYKAQRIHSLQRKDLYCELSTANSVVTQIMASWKKTITTPFKKACTFFNQQPTRDHNHKKSQTEQERQVMDLQGEVMACGYEDVQVMWSMLDRSKSTTTTLNITSST